MENYGDWKLQLSMFDGGASGGAAAGGEGAGAADGGTGAGSEGAQAAQAAQPEQNKAKAFRELIKGEYREEFQGVMNDHLKRRFKDTEALKKQVEGATPLLELMAGKYGVDASDLEGLMKAAQEDESYYEEEASQKGMTVQQLKAWKAMERENAQLKAASEERQRVERASQIQGRWMQEAEATKALYPGFDFEAEAQNPAFARLLKSGVPVRTAYEVVHNDEIISGAMQFATQKATEKTMNNIRARGMRPEEGAAGAQGAAESRFDVSKMTREQRREMANKALRGERVTFDAL